MPSTSSENPESEHAGWVNTWLLGPGRQRRRGSGKKQIDSVEKKAQRRGRFGNARRPLLSLGAEVRVCLRRRSVRTLMRPCESCSFGGNDTMCRMPSAMPPDQRTAHLCFCPSGCRLEEQSVISGVAHGPGRGCPLRHQPGVSASPPGLSSATPSPWRLGACPGRAAPRSGSWSSRLPPASRGA